MNIPADLSKTDVVQIARIVEAIVFASAKAVPIKSILPFLRMKHSFLKFWSLSGHVMMSALG